MENPTSSDEDEEECSVHIDHCIGCHLNDCVELPGQCPVVWCEHGCGIRFHQCKEQQHFMICRWRIRPCVNVKSGCNAQVTSISLIYHLPVCPANVVQCSYRWDPGSPIYQYLKLNKQRPIETQKQQQEEQQQEHQQEPQQQDQQQEPQVVSENASNLSLDLNGVFGRKLVDIPFSFDALPQDERWATKGRWAYSCTELLRRDQHKWHVKNVHDDIPDLFRRLVQQCPFQQYGCPFIQFAVKPKCRDLRFSKHFNCFPNEGELQSRMADLQIGSSDDLTLLDLDYDTFSVIFSYLDNLTLSRLSQTCHDLRNMCSELLESEGIVYPVWSKVNQPNAPVSWKITKTVRKFTVSFEPIREWIQTDAPCIGNHARVCTYNRKKVMTGKVKLVGMAAEE